MLRYFAANFARNWACKCAAAGALLLAGAGFAGSAAAAVAIPNPTVDESAAPKGKETAVLAGGCFWGIQLVFEHVKGVESATSGYAGGHVESPGYEAVSSGATGHAETVKVVYDPAKISYGQILKVFFSVGHDPTQLNRQGNDIGTQYRSVIFYADENQHHIAQAYIDQLNQAKVFSRPIVTQVVPLKNFYRAEDYHQDYAVQHPENPYIMMFDLPKLTDLRRELPDLYVAKRS